MKGLERRERSMAEAVAILVAAIHRSFPTALTRPLPPYEDEDFTLEDKMPSEMDRDQAMNVCLQHAMHIEDTCGLTVLTRVKTT
jgi:hypothetical protein